MNDGKNPITAARALDALRSEAQTGLPLDAQSRLAARLESTLVAGGLFSGTASRISQGEASAGASLPESRAASAVDRLSALLGSHPIASLVTVLSLGAIVGASLHAAYTTQSSAKLEAPRNSVEAPANVAQVSSSLPSEPPVATIGDLPLVASRESAARATDTRRTRPSPVDPAGSALPKASASMAEQLALLERARTALGNGDGNAALRILAEHARDYPTSTLVEEREALTVRAFARAGRVVEAKAKLVQFETRFPGSLMLSALKRAVGEKP
jgi:hypothetical protein